MISVCIPTYNGSKYIKEQLESIFAQIEKGDEIIISDDSSNDQTVEIIKGFNDKRITLIENCKFKSPTLNLENALKRAKGSIVFLADQDDIWLPDKVTKMIKELTLVSLVFSDAIIVDKDLKIIKKSYFNGNSNPKGIFKNIIANNFIGATIAFRAEVLQIALPFPKNIPMHDQWIGLIAEIYFKTSFLAEPLILYRRHGNNLSFSSEKSQNSLFKKFVFRLSLISSLIIRILKIK